MLQNDGAEKEWGSLGAWTLIPSAITYELKINSKTVKVEMNRVGARQESGIADDGAYIIGEAQGGSGKTVNGEAILARRPGQVELPADSSVDVSAHGLWKPGTTAMFDI